MGVIEVPSPLQTLRKRAAGRERELGLVPLKSGECPLLAQECQIPGCHLPAMRTKPSKHPNSPSPHPAAAPSPSHSGLGCPIL